MRLNFALFNAIFTAKDAKSAKLGRLLILDSCATKGFRILIYGFKCSKTYIDAEIFRYLFQILH